MAVTLLAIIVVILLLGRARFLGLKSGLIKFFLFLLLAAFVFGLFVEDPWGVALFLGILAIAVLSAKWILKN